MGFFSWVTADTEESIPAYASGRDMRPVYLLQPDGKPPIKEECYEGYGVFGGVDTYEWLAMMNFGDASLKSLALSADCGDFKINDAHIFVCKLHFNPESEEAFRKATGIHDRTFVYFDNYQSGIDELDGLCMNDATEAKVVSRLKIELRYPLKFSFDAQANYDELPASESSPAQGYFYD